MTSDVLIIWYGAICAYIGILNWKIAIIVTSLGLFLILFTIGYYWIIRKMYLQKSHFPFYVRISDSNTRLPKTKRDLITNFYQKKGKVSHIFITGRNNIYKSHLAIAIGIEATTYKFRTRYFTLSKLFESIESGLEESYYIEKMWNLDQSEFLIIDDVRCVTIDNVELLLKKQNNDFKSIRTVWVLSDETSINLLGQNLLKLSIINEISEIEIIELETF